jgi:hypothetical protein
VNFLGWSGQSSRKRHEPMLARSKTERRRRHPQLARDTPGYDLALLSIGGFHNAGVHCEPEECDR